jgi:hypothetical protein
VDWKFCVAFCVLLRVREDVAAEGGRRLGTVLCVKEFKNLNKMCERTAATEYLERVKYSSACRKLIHFHYYIPTFLCIQFVLIYFHLKILYVRCIPLSRNN